MRIRHQPSRRGNRRIALNLAGMIDVTFLLLMYFMLTMIITAEEDQLASTLQTRTESGHGEQDDFEPQRIEVLVLDGAPAWRIGSRVLRERQELRAVLEALPTDVGVQVLSYEGVEVGFLVTAMQLAHDAGFDQVTVIPVENNVP